MNFTRKIVVYISLMAVGVVCGALLLFNLPATGWQALSVATGSMRPKIPQGSLVFVHRVPISTLKVGDVITYTNVQLAKEPITHRIIKTTTVGHGIRAFVTKGDANQSADPEIVSGQVIGEVVWHVPVVGKGIIWLHQPVRLILVLGIPALIIIVSEFQLMIRRLQEYAREEAEEKTARRNAAQPIAAPLGPSVMSRRPMRHRPRVPIIRLVLAVLMLPALALTVQATRSELVSNSVALAPNRLSVASTTPPTSGNCPPGTSSVSITNTGPGSKNKVTISTTCVVTSSNSTSISVSNNSAQTSTSGSASSSNNTSGGNTSSGSASNSSSSSTITSISSQ